MPASGLLLRLGRDALAGRRLGDGLVFREAHPELIQALRPAPEPVPGMARQLVPELLDQDVARLQLAGQKTHQPLQFLGIVR